MLIFCIWVGIRRSSELINFFKGVFKILAFKFSKILFANEIAGFFYLKIL